jgi:signal transduction histidine kinase
MSEQIKALGIGMEITLQGEPFELTSIQIENIYKICREAVTNAIRHGNADLINIIFRFSTNRFSMYIIDNGGGCITFKKGMGLSGIEERAEEIGGTVSYNSYIGEGFSIQLTLKT